VSPRVGAAKMAACGTKEETGSWTLWQLLLLCVVMPVSLWLQLLLLLLYMSPALPQASNMLSRDSIQQLSSKSLDQLRSPGS
jgi:hypothetical protein